MMFVEKNVLLRMEGAGNLMSAVCCAGTLLSAEGVLFGHWFTPHALCSVLSVVTDSIVTDIT